MGIVITDLRTLKNRKETITYKDDTYELVLDWNLDDIRECIAAMPPELAYIRKNGKNFAFIQCSSGRTGFNVYAYGALLRKPDWEHYFKSKDINRIPFKDILCKLPI